MPQQDIFTQDRARLRAAARPLGARGMTYVVAQAFGLPPGVLRDYSRAKQACQARHFLYFVLHEICGWPGDYIAEVLHRDQATVRHGLKRARDLVQTAEGQAALHLIEDLLLKGTVR